jgi:hypothetical protein
VFPFACAVSYLTWLDKIAPTAFKSFPGGINLAKIPAFSAA